MLSFYKELSNENENEIIVSFFTLKQLFVQSKIVVVINDINKAFCVVNNIHTQFSRKISFILFFFAFNLPRTIGKRTIFFV